VIGVGGAGFNIATRAWAFGMNVIGVDPEDYPFTPIIKKYHPCPKQLLAV